jgi:hypothetical protein
MEQIMSCPSCGMPSTGPRFCRECGSRLLSQSRPHAQASHTGRDGPTTIALFNSSDISRGPGIRDGSVAVAIFGNITGNLTSQPFPPGETRITLSAIFGSAKLVVPPGLAIKVTGLSIFSGGKVKGRRLCGGIFNFHNYETPGYSQATRQLRIDATSIFGGLKIK